MHEEALFRDLRRRLEAVAAEQRVTRIRAVSIWVGALSHVTEASVRARWDETVRGSPAEGARLSVEVSEDPSDPRAQGVVLRDVAVEETA